MTYAVIMAGGSGTRYWPKSRKSLPKHLIQFGEMGVLLERTVERLAPFFPKERIFVITTREQEAICRKYLAMLPPDNLICEPLGMDSAPCVALSAAIISRIDPDAVISMFPADHLIYPEDAFLRTISRACEHAKSGKYLVTLGINPDRPAIEYGYIGRGFLLDPGVFTVREFREKPTAAIAEKLISSGEYYWNCGIFTWRASKILSEIARFLPNTHERVMRIADNWGKPEFASTFANEYPSADKISIDYAVMEKTSDAIVVQAEFTWDDVGTWLSLQRHCSQDVNGNIIIGNVSALDASNSIISGETDRLVAVLGVKDMIIVDTGDALLVMPKSESHRIKELLEKLKKEGLQRYL
ncbi:MAG: sugar phosphate nucleotidyltransferase [Candidatus Brocadiia bacterium]